MMTAALLFAGVGAHAQSAGSSGTTDGGSSSGSGKGAFGGGTATKSSGGDFGGNGSRVNTPPGTTNSEPVRTPVTPVAPDTPPPTLPSEPVRPGEPPETPGRADPGVARPPVTTSAQTWTLIQGSNYEQRGDFMNGIQRIGAQMDASVTTLKRKRATYDGDPHAWDAEMKRLDDARAYLQSTSDELAKATSVNWDERKERVARAWERLQAAYDRASSMATP